ncbi:MAG: lysostaphin resistance A-like protein [Kiloniellales bacterium]
MSDSEPPPQDERSRSDSPSLIPTTQQRTGLATVGVLDVLLLIAGMLLVGFGVTLGFRSLLGAAGLEWLALPLIVVVQSLGFLALLWLVVLQRRHLDWRCLGLKPAPPAWLGRAVVLGLGAVPVAMAINYLVQALLGETWENPQIETLAPEGGSLASGMVLLLLVSFVVPFVEELLFRGLLFAWLAERWSLALAYPLSALAFASLHFLLPLFPALFLMGLLLAYVYRESGSIWAPIIVHGLFNGLMLSVVLMARSFAPEVV